MKDFSNYCSTDFLNEDSFIRWIMKSDKSAFEFWDQYIKENPTQKDEIDEAFEIFNHLRFVHEELTVEEIFALWDNVKHHSEHKKYGIYNVLKYAAIFLLVFATGVFSYHFYNKLNTNEFTIAESIPVNFDEAQLILSDGKTVPLLLKDSEIKYNTTGEKVIINNDTITQERAQQKSKLNRVIIPYGRSSQVMLSDGTKVWLNAGSQLMYPSVFSKNQREVLLIGEAFFDVIRNEESPFIVRTDFVDIEVLGTNFDVSAYPDDRIFETILVSGSISVEIKKEGFLSGKEKVVLNPNQMISLNKKEGVSKVSEVDVSVYISWKDGMLKFEKQDLSRVLRKLERYYN